MQRALIFAGLAIAVALGASFALGLDRVVFQWALEGQREAQTLLARALRALRAGEAGALAALMGVCFSYGVFHAAGPGHGKLLIGGYGAAGRVGALKLSFVALISSLAQALTAIALVAGGLWVWGISRARMTGLADDLFQPLSFALIAVVGLWLAWRGARGLMALRQAHAAPHDVPHDHLHEGTDMHCATCGHAHMPAVDDVARAGGLRDLVVLVGVVAIRPCTGALFVLILTAQMGIFAAGIAGALAMGIGTASVTVLVAILSVTLREGALRALPNSAALSLAQPTLAVAVGLFIAIIAGRLALGAI